MNEKQIKKALLAKVQDWVESIDTHRKDVIDAIVNDLVVTGGCIPSMIMGETPNDYDCYFKTKKSALIVANYYCGITQTRQAQEKQRRAMGDLRGTRVDDKITDISNVCMAWTYTDLGLSLAMGGGSLDRVVSVLKPHPEDHWDQPTQYAPICISSNAITLTDGVQIVVRFAGSIEEVHANFDYAHTQAYFELNSSGIRHSSASPSLIQSSSKLCVPSRVYECIANKQLIYTGSKYPICSMFRIRKFMSRGWTISAGEILKISMQISELDLSDLETLKDQLLGVDTLYFLPMINALNNRTKSFPGTPDGGSVGAAAVMKLVDEIW